MGGRGPRFLPHIMRISLAVIILGGLYLALAYSSLAAPSGASQEAAWRGQGALAWEGAEGRWADIFGRPGVNGPVYDLVFHEDMLILGGAFQRAGHIDAAYLAGWTGSDWVALGDPQWGFGGGAGVVAVHAICVYEDLLVAGGRITGGSVTDVVTAWDGEAWGELGELGDPQVSTVRALTLYGGGRSHTVV